MGLFDSFLGQSQRNDISQASQQANSQYRRGLEDFTNTTKDYLGQSLSQFDPLNPSIQQGYNALGLYGNATGANGAGAQSDFYRNFQTDPGFNAQLQAGVNTLDRSAAARGLLHSGGQNRDLFSYGQKFMGDAFNNRLSQLFGLGQFGTTLGANTAGNRANLLTGAGGNIANAQFGTSQLFANNAINTGNAMASASNQGINNILGAARIAMSPFSGSASLFGGNPSGGGWNQLVSGVGMSNQERQR